MLGKYWDKQKCVFCDGVLNNARWIRQRPKSKAIMLLPEWWIWFHQMTWYRFMLLLTFPLYKIVRKCAWYFEATNWQLTALLSHERKNHLNVIFDWKALCGCIFHFVATHFAVSFIDFWHAFKCMPNTVMHLVRWNDGTHFKTMKVQIARIRNGWQHEIIPISA